MASVFDRQRVCRKSPIWPIFLFSYHFLPLLSMNLLTIVRKLPNDSLILSCECPLKSDIHRILFEKWCDQSQRVRHLRLFAETTAWAGKHSGAYVRKIKIPFDPPFPRGDDYSSLWQREVRKDFKRLFSEQLEHEIETSCYYRIRNILFDW